MAQDEWADVHIDVILRHTTKALLVRIDDEEHWIPRSQVDNPENHRTGDENVTMTMKRWLALENGFSFED